jgi:hypothetical protein
MNIIYNKKQSFPYHKYFSLSSMNMRIACSHSTFFDKNHYGVYFENKIC